MPTSVAAPTLAPSPDLMALLDGFAAPSLSPSGSQTRRRSVRRAAMAGSQDAASVGSQGVAAAPPAPPQATLAPRGHAEPLLLAESSSPGSSSPLVNLSRLWEVDASSPRSVASSSLAGARPLTPDDVTGLSSAQLAALDRDAAEAEQAARQSRREIARAHRREQLRRGSHALECAWLVALGVLVSLGRGLLPSHLASGADVAVQGGLSLVFALVGATVGIAIGALAAAAALGAAAARAGRRAAAGSRTRRGGGLSGVRAKTTGT